MKLQELTQIELIDTHCHIHSDEFYQDLAFRTVFKESIAGNVTGMLLVGTSLDDSKTAVTRAKENPQYNIRASVGIHPHEAAKMTNAQIDNALDGLRRLAKSDVVSAIGECGFDFFYNERSEYLEKQTRLLVGQLEIARDLKLPLSFHVRDAFDDFWPIFQRFVGVKGVLHSFTDSLSNLQKAQEHGLYIGINGIATFTSDKIQAEMFKSIPLEEIVLETDSPFLTPVPFRGTINTPKNVEVVARFMAGSRGTAYEKVARQTTINARRLFEGF